jgi:hypothetical protein
VAGQEFDAGRGAALGAGAAASGAGRVGGGGHGGLAGPAPGDRGADDGGDETLFVRRVPAEYLRLLMMWMSVNRSRSSRWTALSPSLTPTPEPGLSPFSCATITGTVMLLSPPADADPEHAPSRRAGRADQPQAARRRRYQVHGRREDSRWHLKTRSRSRQTTPARHRNGRHVGRRSGRRCRAGP